MQMIGSQKLSDFLYHLVEMKHVATQQDLIPWKSFMKCKVCKALIALQGTAVKVRTCINNQNTIIHEMGPYLAIITCLHDCHRCDDE